MVYQHSEDQGYRTKGEEDPGPTMADTGCKNVNQHGGLKK